LNTRQSPTQVFTTRK